MALLNHNPVYATYHKTAYAKAKKAVKANGWGEPGHTWMPGEDRDPFGHDDDTPEEERAD